MECFAAKRLSELKESRSSTWSQFKSGLNQFKCGPTPVRNQFNSGLSPVWNQLTPVFKEKALQRLIASYQTQI